MNDCIIIGDLNSNKIWDRKHRICNHSDVVRELEEKGIDSLYHKFHNEEQGKESIPTFFLQKNLAKPYHIDHVYGSNQLINSVQQIVLGKVEEWLSLSDHMPMYLILKTRGQE
jgi:endonuclease/exonuclease/phosphatase family metal-dependent hydrolase